MLTQLKNDLDHGVFVVLSKEEQILDHEIKHESDLMDKIDTSLVPKDKIELQNRFNQAELAKNDPEWRNQKGETALMIFAEKGDLIGVKSQLQYKQNLNLKANDGSTAIHHAIACGQIEIVKILHEAGAKINLRDNNESEALALAIERKNYLVADYLINQGARIDIIYQGMTYLMLAMKHDDLALFNRLLAAGADPSIKNHQGKDIKMLAREQNKKNFLRILNTMMI
jgi:ankyrin repeat protein